MEEKIIKKNINLCSREKKIEICKLIKNINVNLLNEVTDGIAINLSALPQDIIMQIVNIVTPT